MLGLLTWQVDCLPTTNRRRTFLCAQATGNLRYRICWRVALPRAQGMQRCAPIVRTVFETKGAPMPPIAFRQILANLQEKSSPILSPTLMAQHLAIQIQELATHAGVHRNTLRIHPESTKLQHYLRNVVRVLSAIAEIQPDSDKAVFYFRNTPIASFKYKTAYDLAGDGRADDVVNYLASVHSGFAG